MQMGTNTLTGGGRHNPGQEPRGGPEFESLHSGRDRPRSRDFSCATDASVDGRNAQIALKNPENALATNSRICAATLSINADCALEAHRRATEGEGRLSAGSPG